MIDYLKRLLGIKVDPTRDWPELPPRTPALDLRTLQIGPLKFWDPLAKARDLGRPDLYQRGAGKVDELVFARAGYLLEFHRRRFSYVAYLIDRDDNLDGRAHEGLVFSRPKLTLPDGSVVELSPEVDLETLAAWLGKPASADVDAEESVVVWRREGVTLEAELNARGLLRRFNLYPSPA